MKESLPLLIDPCSTCLIRACCSEYCEKLEIFLLETIHRLAINKDDPVIENFPEEQRALVWSNVKKYNEKYRRDRRGTPKC